MTFTPMIALSIINAIAFLVGAFCLIKLAPILRKVIAAKRANLPEILIAGQTWSVNYKLVALITLPLVAYVGLVSIYAWVVYRIIG
jgi:hypothetical protein